jgi:hypothetical protein
MAPAILGLLGHSHSNLRWRVRAAAVRRPILA